MKKILYVQSDSKLNGSGKALLNLIISIKDQYEIEVFLPDANDELGIKLKAIGIKCIGSPFALRWYPKFKRTWKIYKNLRPLRNFLLGLIEETSAMKVLEKEVIKFKPDIIHTNVGPVDIGFKIAYKHGIPHVWHLREYQDLDFGVRYFPTKKTFLSMIHSNSTRNISITKGIFDHFNLEQGKDYVIYDGVIDENTILQYSDKSPIEGKYFLYVSGAISEKKGATNVLISFSQFAKEDKNSKLVYVGLYYQRDVYFQKLKAIIKKEALEGRVLFLGRKSTSEVYNIMYHASAFLMLSKSEGFGFTTAEAMFNHCLVIGRNTAGTKEQFDNGLSFSGNEIGLRVNNVKDTIEAMKWVLQPCHSEEINKMKASAKKTVEHFYTYQKYSRSISRIYENI